MITVCFFYVGHYTLDIIEIQQDDPDMYAVCCFHCLFSLLVGYMSCTDSGFLFVVSEKTNTPVEQTIKSVYNATQHSATPSVVSMEILLVRF